jgi:hypothetical protein
MTGDERRDRSMRRRAELAEEQAHADEARRKRWTDQKMYLTREEAEAGAPCRGCGVPVMGERQNERSFASPTSQSPQALADEDAFRTRHATCHSHRWSVEGFRGMHCGQCCPPPPLSAQQVERLAVLLSRPTTATDQHRWHLTLTCGHRLEVSAHKGNRPSWHPSVWKCVQCDLARGVVASTHLGPQAREPSTSATTTGKAGPSRRRPTRAELEAENAAMKAELAVRNWQGRQIN